MTNGKGPYFQMKQLSNCLEIQYQFGIKVLDQYGHFLKIAKKFLPGVGFVPRAKPVYTVLQASWMQGFTQKFWRDIFQKSGDAWK